MLPAFHKNYFFNFIFNLKNVLDTQFENVFLAGSRLWFHLPSRGLQTGAQGAPWKLVVRAEWATPGPPSPLPLGQPWFAHYRHSALTRDRRAPLVWASPHYAGVSAAEPDLQARPVWLHMFSFLLLKFTSIKIPGFI